MYTVRRILALVSTLDEVFGCSYGTSIVTIRLQHQSTSTRTYSRTVHRYSYRVPVPVTGLVCVLAPLLLVRVCTWIQAFVTLDVDSALRTVVCISLVATSTSM